ncbi:hypothetical protein OK074_5122 [Actinobacteria bacterium OK074]|nr:hypothetical protein OK074_5122 [Actinobacteria bacterium OK074]
MRHVPGDGRYVILICTAAVGIIAGWLLPSPASWLGFLMTAISMGGMIVLSSDLTAKIRDEERVRMRRELRERAHPHEDQES